MQNRNYILFLGLSMATLIAWNTFVVPRIAPTKPAAIKNAKADAAVKAELAKAAADKAATAKAGDKQPTAEPIKPGAQASATKTGEKPAETAKTAETKDNVPAAKPVAQVPQFEFKIVTIGSIDPATGYFLNVDLTSKGAAIASAEFNDPRYRELTKTDLPLKIVGNGLDLRSRKARQDRDEARSGREIASERLREEEAKSHPGELSTDLEQARAAFQAANERLKQADRNVALSQTTFNTDVPAIDSQLTGDQGNVAARDWKVAQVTADPKHPGTNSAVTFEYPSPDGQFVFEKRYSLETIEGGAGSSRDARDIRDTATQGYLLHLDVTLRNAGDKDQSLSYTLQGPVGLPLENVQNARKFRDLRLGFLSPTGTLLAQTKTVSQVQTDEEKNKVEEWKSPIKYIGVDVQYFAALVLPTDDQLSDRTIDRSVPMLLDAPGEKQNTDLSVQLDSKKVVLAPKQAVTHHFELFAGPKRRALLVPLHAEAVLDFGWFGSVSNIMLTLLNMFHTMGIPYGVAIICLTVLVRACMFPLSLRQTAQAQRMKLMQPKVAELKKKYANDKEKLAKANLELMREHKINPLAGCLPVLLQMPIFIGLYQALQNSVDLRLAPFLYFKNLAGPDALFHMPFSLPFLGSDFNLLPIITVALFVVQQKMFMPPPTDEQQEMQYKMMNIMMVVMGVMFYKVPSGLCVYFISSSLWGLSERKLLEFWKPVQAVPSADSPPSDDPPSGPRGKGPQEPSGPSGPTGRARGVAGSFLQKLLNAADAANSDAATGSKTAISRRRELSPGKRNGKRPR